MENPCKCSTETSGSINHRVGELVSCLQSRPLHSADQGSGKHLHLCPCPYTVAYVVYRNILHYRTLAYTVKKAILPLGFQPMISSFLRKSISITLCRLRQELLESPCECGIEPPGSISHGVRLRHQGKRPGFESRHKQKYNDIEITINKYRRSAFGC